MSLDPGDLRGIPLLSPAELLVAQGEVAATGSESFAFPEAHVLVVDDGAENRELARLVLEEAGLSVSEAENGQVAVAKVLAGKFDLVLMDMQMPVMDGYAATRTLRNAGCRLPIVALTANAMKGFEKDIEEAGFSGYLTKPIDISLLLADLAKRLGGRRLAPDEQRPGSSTPIETDRLVKDAIAAEAVQRRPVVSRLAGNPRLAPVVCRFAAALPAKLAEMRAALRSQAYPELAALAHWLKGGGGSVGYDEFFEPARALETAAREVNAADARDHLAAIEDLAERMVAPGAEALTGKTA